MELALIIIVGLLFALIGFACVISVAIGLPGVWILLALAVLINFLDPLYLAEGSGHTFRWELLIACGVIAVIGEILEFIAGALGAKKGGSSRRGMWGAIIGGVGGAILGTAIPIPIIGSLIGAVIGTFIGAILGEVSGREPTTVKESLKPATGATIGRVLGTLAKIPIALLVWVALSVDAFWP